MIRAQPDATLAAELEELQSRGLYRRPRRVQSRAGPRALLEGREVVVLGSNDYLGLAGDPRVTAAAAEAAARWGAGAGGSRLTTGNLPPAEALETALAAFKGTEAALLFPTGYQAAVGVIPALAGRGDLVLSDALNHACLIDGCRLSRAEVRVYPHGDVERAAELLRDRERFRRCLVVSDGVFSMDGDLAPLRGLARLCEERDAWLMVDDAHGTGVLGETGTGTAEHLGVGDQVPIQMGTLSKALGSQGGFVCGSAVLIEYLRNRARSFIFSTGPAPATCAAALEALRLAREEPWRRRRVSRLAGEMRRGLEGIGLSVPPVETPILPLVVGTAERAVRLAEGLEAEGVWVPAIRPPTVPEGTARLRVSLSAAHSDEDLSRALETFRRAAARLE